jgi:UDP-glucose:(heptosyl)LPS alpha-1,3-glucosyltransferase
MKIAFVVHDFLMGTGHGRYCVELARRFAREHDIHLVANQFEAGLDFPFTRHRVPALRFSALAAVLSFPAGAEKILARERFDVIHAQGYSSNHADVITAHVCNAARYKRTPASAWSKRLFPALVIPRERKFYQRATNSEIITVSHVLKRELQFEYGASSRVVYHGVDTERLRPGANQNPDHWLFVGEAIKGLRQSISALKNFPEARLTVVTRSNVDEYQALAQSLGVLGQVQFLPPTNDLRPIYQNAGLFLYPSNYDAFGMVVAEAMSSGLAVVVGRNIGAAEWINDGANGFLCDPQSGDSISGAIQRARQNPAEVGAAAQRTAHLHTWDHCASATMEIYQRAIANKRTSK